MASRLYPSTRFLFLQIVSVLRRLGLTAICSPTQFDLIALYIAGLTILDKRQTACRIAEWLPGRCHDALNRLLRVMPLSTRALMGLLAAFARSQGIGGYLSLDDVVVSKLFAHKLPWAGWAYSSSLSRCIYGIHIVVILWCKGPLHIPVAFRLWRPEDRCRKGHYCSKLQLAREMIIELQTAGLPFTYLAFDTWYNARWFTKFLNHCGIIWVSTLKSNSYVIYHHHKQRVQDLAPTLKLKWRQALDLRAVAIKVHLPGYGIVRLVVTKDGHGKWGYIVTNALDVDLTAIVLRKRSRWNIEVLFRDAKQLNGLGACQCWVDQAMVRHVAFALWTYTVLQLLKVNPPETVGDVKERLQLQVVRAGATPPEPLRARAA